MDNKPTIGILALQGAVREHQRAIERCGALVVHVKRLHELEDIDGLIIPGGESTTIGKLLAACEMIEPIKRRAAEGMAVFGTCAGLILLAERTVEKSEHLLGLMDMTVRRNAFGRQVDSFESDVEVMGFSGKSIRAVFIRAPWIESTGPGVKVLAEEKGRPVVVEEGRFLACAFHPELTDDLRLHKYFLDKVVEREGRLVYPHY